QRPSESAQPLVPVCSADRAMPQRYRRGIAQRRESRKRKVSDSARHHGINQDESFNANLLNALLQSVRVRRVSTPVRRDPTAQLGFGASPRRETKKGIRDAV